MCKFTFGKFLLGELHIWEVATWENTFGKLLLGKNLTAYIYLYIFISEQTIQIYAFIEKR